MGGILMLSLLSIIFLVHTQAMIMRNNALMSKMVSKFQGKENREPRDNREPSEHKDQSNTEEQRQGGNSPKLSQKGQQAHVLSLMQNVLCKNFPSIPCEIITKDETLKNLIGKSIQQLKYKKMTLERSTPAPNYNQLTLFPVINSDDLSHFLAVSNTGFFKPTKQRKKQKKNFQEQKHWSSQTKVPKTVKTPVYNGRKKLRKFYPHKIKYKDKQGARGFLTESDEKLSMSVETPRESERDVSIRKKHFHYGGDPSDPPVWRIDYMKHGEPSLNMFGYGTDSLKGKIIKSGRNNMMVDENVLEQAARRDVLHPDVYIKKNFPRKNISGNSEGLG